jgi:imidazolonepropionase-like amidohydrolase
MKKLFFILLLVGTLPARAQEDLKNRELVFRNVNVIPMDQERVLTNQTVTVRNGKISAITDASKTKPAAGALVVDARGKYLIPGLAEMHAHVPPVDDMEPMKEVLTLFLANGITTIRGMLGHSLHLKLRDQIRSGEVLGPHFYTTGPSFNGLTVKSPEEGAQRVRDQKAAGYDYLKLHPGLTLRNFNAVATTAKEVGIPFVGHVSSGVGVWRAIEAGYSSIDHLDGFVEGLIPPDQLPDESKTGLFAMFVSDKADRSQIPKLMQALKAQHIWVVPTQALAERWFSPIPPKELDKAPEMKYMNQQTRESWVKAKQNLQANKDYDKEEIKKYIQFRRELIKACHDSGVGLLLGSDGPQIFNVPGFSVHHELKYLVDAGLTPYQALRTGTVNVAEYLGQSATAGTIAVGKQADLVLLNGNPLQNISQTTRIEGVLLGDQWMPKGDLEGKLKKLEK